MQKNLPRYTPDWVRRVAIWSQGSRREISYALADDHRTLLWFANQRAVEYHVTLFTTTAPQRPDFLVMDVDPPEGAAFPVVVAAARLVRQSLAEAGLAGAVKTSGAKGLHVFVPLAEASAEDVAAATRAVAARAERIDPELATTAFVKDERQGKVFLDSTRAGGATVVAAYSPRIRPGVPVSTPVDWDDLDAVHPAELTVHTVPGLLAGSPRWADRLPSAAAAASGPGGRGPRHSHRPGAGDARGQAAQAGPPGPLRHRGDRDAQRGTRRRVDGSAGRGRPPHQVDAVLGVLGGHVRLLARHPVGQPLVRHPRPVPFQRQRQPDGVRHLDPHRDVPGHAQPQVGAGDPLDHDRDPDRHPVPLGPGVGSQSQRW